MEPGNEPWQWQQIGHIRKSHPDAMSAATQLFPGSLVKGNVSHKQENTLYTEGSSLFVGLPHLKVSSAKASWVAKYLEHELSASSWRQKLAEQGTDVQ